MMSNFSDDATAVLRVLGSASVLYKPMLARILGSVNAAIWLGQLLYWDGKQNDPNGWIHKTAAEFEEETALSERQHEGARELCVSLGVVEYKRMGIPALPNYRVNTDRLIKLISEYIRSENKPSKLGQNVLTDKDISPGDLLGQNVLSDTQTTLETTTENTAEEERADAQIPLSDSPSPASAPLQVPDEIRNQPAPRKARKPRQSTDGRKSKQEDTTLAHPAINLYRETLLKTPNARQRKEIITIVGDTDGNLTRWNEVLDEWALHDWKVWNVPGMLSRFESGSSVNGNGHMNGNSAHGGANGASGGPGTAIIDGYSALPAGYEDCERVYTPQARQLLKRNGEVVAELVNGEAIAWTPTN